MRRQAVASSKLHAIGYEAAHRSLEIEFTGGTVYESTLMFPPMSTAD